MKKYDFNFPKILFFLMMSFAIILPIVSFAGCEGCVHEKNEEDIEWKVFTKGKIVDIDPIPNGLMIHFDSNTWIKLDHLHYKSKRWPVLAETGIMYESNNKTGAKAFKWEKTNIKPPVELDIKPSVKLEIPIQKKEWKNCGSPPEMNEIVIVEFYNKSIALAYINKYGEWKLNINKDQYKGGNTIENIIRWREIGL